MASFGNINVKVNTVIENKIFYPQYYEDGKWKFLYKMDGTQAVYSTMAKAEQAIDHLRNIGYIPKGGATAIVEGLLF